MIDSILETHATLAITRSMGVRREEYLDYMTFRENRRPLFIEIFGPLLGLREEWQRQGATPRELDFSAFRFRGPLFGAVSANTGWIGGTEETILESNPEYIIARDRMGRTMKLSRKASTLPLPMDYPVRDWDDWLRIKQHYAFFEERFGTEWQAKARAAQDEGRVLTIGIPGGFDEPRQLMGEEQFCLSFHTQPDLIHDMLDTIGTMAEQVLERITQHITVDQLSVHEDMAGKSGPLIGPRHVREFICPYYARIWDLLKSRGTPLFFQDSDGDMSPLIPEFLEAGLNVMGPMEPVGGNDIVALRRQYGPRLAFTGGIDKHVLRRDQAAITAELEYRIPPMVRSGGAALGIDHRIPNGTPLRNYRFYIEKAWEILDRETTQ